MYYIKHICNVTIYTLFGHKKGNSVIREQHGWTLRALFSVR